MPDAKQPLHTAAQLRGDGLGKQGGGAELRGLHRRGAAPKRALPAGLSEGQERDDVARRQGRIGAGVATSTLSTGSARKGLAKFRSPRVRRYWLPRMLISPASK